MSSSSMPYVDNLERINRLFNDELSAFEVKSIFPIFV